MEGPTGGAPMGGPPAGGASKPGMPTWLKVVLIVLGVMLLLCGGGLFGIYQFGKSLVKSATDPETKKRVTSEICKIDIPSDYNIEGAFDLMGMKMSMIKYAKNNQQIMFMKLPKSSGSDQDMLKSFSDENATNQLLGQSGSGNKLKIEKVKSRETVKINGHDFPFVQCDFDQRGKKQEGIMGYYYCPESKSGFLVFALNEPGSYDNSVTLNLLGDIKCCAKAEKSAGNKDKDKPEDEIEQEEK